MEQSSKTSMTYHNLEQELENSNVVVDKLIAKQDGLNLKIEEQKTKYDIINSKVGEYKTKIESVNIKNQKKDLDSVQGSIKDIGSSVSKVINKVGRWALAVFGIRSAYLAVRKSASILSQYNKQISADIQYIQYALAMTLQPVVEWLIRAVYTLLGYINLIAKAWFGVDLFSRSSANNMNSMAGSAKEIKKSLAGFDEINQLSSNSSADAGGGAGAPSVDLSKWQGDVPAWLQWIISNKELILALLAGIVTYILLINLGLNGIKALGIGVAIAGIVLFIQELIDYISKLDASLYNNGTSWEDFGGIVTAIGLIVLGIGIIIGGIPAIIAGVVVLIIGIILKNWEKIRKWGSTVIDWINDKLSWIEKKFGILGEILVDPIRIAIDIIGNLFQGMFTGIKQIFDGILLIFNGDFKNGLINIGRGILNILISIINTFIGGFNAIISPIRALIVAGGKILGKSWSMQNIRIPTISYLATGGIVDVPKRGVNIGGAIAGESGTEGVLPLTNSETMERLGREIGKWITVNLALTNKIDNRTLSKAILNLQNENNFARNGG